MAELTKDTAPSGRRKRLPSPKVDLTAMVDLAFLLITFFMLTTSLSESTVMEINMPVEARSEPVPDNRSMTVCLGSNDKIIWYMGTSDNPQNLRVTSAPELRNVFSNQMKSVLQLTGKPLIVLIKPAESSKFKNLVDVLDELAIVKALCNCRYYRSRQGAHA